MRALLDYLAGTRVETLLDAGCGDGRTTRRIAECVVGLRHLAGIDRDPAALDEAADQLVALAPDVGVDLTLGDVAAIAFEDGRFDAVVLCDVLHHLDHPGIATAECYRVLRPGGALFFSEMISDSLDPAEMVGRDLHHLKADIDRLNGIPHGPTLAQSNLLELVEAAGFSVGWHTIERHRGFDPRDADGVIADQRDFMEDYLQHAANTPDYALLRRRAAFLFHRMETVGVAPAASLSLVASRPA